MPTPALTDTTEARIRTLWLSAQAGDERAYRAALALVAQRLRRYFGRRWVAMPDLVDDLVQDTLLALHLQRADYDPRLPLGGWVFAIARHKLVDARRRHGRREALHTPLDDMDTLQHGDADSDPTGPLAADPAGCAQDLQRLLASLPAAQHQAIVLTRLSGLTMAEASARTGVSVSALKVQVHRGLKRLTLGLRAAPRVTAC